MQSLDVISVNFWHILISLCNLLLLFLIIKKFLYKPVKRMVETRRQNIETQYSEAANAQKEADQNREMWQKKLEGADSEAKDVIAKATKKAEDRGDRILADAKDKADIIVREAESQAALEFNKAQSEIKKEIVDVSAILTEKIIGRELNLDDHRSIIDSVIAEIGEDDGSDK